MVRGKFLAAVGALGLLATTMAVGVGARPAAADAYTPVYDSTGGAKDTPAVPAQVTVAASAALEVIVLDADESGTVSIYPCSSGGTTPPILVSYAYGSTVSNLVRTGTAASTLFCFAPSGPAHLRILQWAEPTDPWQALTRATVFDGTVTVGTDTTGIAVAGLAAGATGVSLLVTLADGGSVGAYDCALARPQVGKVVGPAGVQSAEVVILQPAGAKTLCLQALGAAGVHTKVKVEVTGQYGPAVPPSTNGFPYVVFQGQGRLAAPGLEPVTPSRLFDTRSNGGARRPAGSVYELDLAAMAPPGSTAVVMNVTATDATANGFVTVYPCDIARPTASNLNYTVGTTVPNLVTVGLATSAKVCFYSHTPVHLLADLGGWYLLDGGWGYHALAPTRLFDTRSVTGRTPVAAGGVYTYDLTGKVDATTSAVTMNVTVTEPASEGYLTVYPCDEPRPLASNLNYAKNQTVPNLVTVKVGTSLKVCFYAQKQLHLLADLAGSFEDGLDTGFYGLPPQRLFDSRLDPEGALVDGGELALTIPLPKLDGAVFNVTVTEPKANGFVTVYPCGATRPVVSNLNYAAAQTVANLVAVQLNATSQACFYVQRGTHLVVDLAGVYSPDPFIDAIAKLTTQSILQGAAPGV